MISSSSVLVLVGLVVLFFIEIFSCLQYRVKRFLEGSLVKDKETQPGLLQIFNYYQMTMLCFADPFLHPFSQNLEKLRPSRKEKIPAGIPLQVMQANMQNKQKQLTRNLCKPTFPHQNTNIFTYTTSLFSDCSSISIGSLNKLGMKFKFFV